MTKAILIRTAFRSMAASRSCWIWTPVSSFIVPWWQVQTRGERRRSHRGLSMAERDGECQGPKRNTRSLVEAATLLIYVISAPKILRVGSSENVVIQVHGYTEAFDATLSLKSYPDKKVTFSSGYVNLSPENKFQNAALLTLQPNQVPREESPVSHVYLEVVSKHFSKSKKIPITYNNGILFIHTDKPVYTPDQSVKIRVYSLGDDLKPAKRETVLTFIDPEGSEVDIVEENDYTGIISFPDFKIPSNPK